MTSPADLNALALDAALKAVANEMPQRVGSPEALANPDHKQRWEKHRDNAASRYATASITAYLSALTAAAPTGEGCKHDIMIIDGPPFGRLQKCIKCGLEFYTQEQTTLPPSPPVPPMEEVRAVLQDMLKDHENLTTDITSACDASNWDSDRKTGDYFAGWNEATTQFLELVTEYINSEPCQKARALLTPHTEASAPPKAEIIDPYAHEHRMVRDGIDRTLYCSVCRLAEATIKQAEASAPEGEGK